jgi:Leucine-rich repeat (LRR) protein
MKTIELCLPAEGADLSLLPGNGECFARFRSFRRISSGAGRGTTGWFSVLVAATLLVVLAQSLSGQVVFIPDPELRVALVRALEPPSGNLTVQDLQRLTVLDASFRRIRNLDELENARNLAELNLSGNERDSITSIQTLTNLHSLNLAGNYLQTFSCTASGIS